MNNKYDIAVPFGQLRLGKITSYDVNRGVAKVELSNSTELAGAALSISIPIPSALFSNDGIFIGTKAKIGTPVVVARGEGTNWYFVSFIINNPNLLPTLNAGELLISAGESKISLDISNNIKIGGNQNPQISINSKSGIYNSSFNYLASFTEGSREVNGVIKRDLKPLQDFPSYLKLSSDKYLPNLFDISLDPTVSPSFSFTGVTKNPPFIEKRELVYEFAFTSNVQDDLSESKLYQDKGEKTTEYLYPDRRLSRSDTLSLSLTSPNYLLETIKGTVVDVFGNILDLNRFPIPVGSKNLTLKSASNGGNADSFVAIKAQERKSIAYHFEINARKDLIGKNGKIQLPDISSKDDYARNRSRFFLDVDKEGQFKLNVPASSEIGNIPLLTRYENYSTFNSEDNNNPNKFIINEDHLDIYHDSFSKGGISIKDESGIVSPKDRITGEHIKHGTAYHDILDSFVTFDPGFADLFLDFQLNPDIDFSKFPTISKIVSDIIIVGGPNANAGGRSGSLHFDGSLEFNLGANTIDRQSLWLDTAGSIIGMLGRDKNNISAALALDGDLLIQIGGKGVSGDSRFQELNAFRGGALDIRVLNDGFTVSVIRIDKNGVTVATPGTMSFKARNIDMKAEGNIIMEADNISIQNRIVNKIPAPSI